MRQSLSLVMLLVSAFLPSAVAPPPVSAPPPGLSSVLSDSESRSSDKGKSLFIAPPSPERDPDRPLFSKYFEARHFTPSIERYMNDAYGEGNWGPKPGVGSDKVHVDLPYEQQVHLVAKDKKDQKTRHEIHLVGHPDRTVLTHTIYHEDPSTDWVTTWARKLSGRKPKELSIVHELDHNRGTFTTEVPKGNDGASSSVLVEDKKGSGPASLSNPTVPHKVGVKEQFGRCIRLWKGSERQNDKEERYGP